MKRSDVLRLLKRAAQERRLVFSGHALDEMDADGETRESVAAAIVNAKSIKFQENGRWRVHAAGLTVILHIEGRSTVFVWTVFLG